MSKKEMMNQMDNKALMATDLNLPDQRSKYVGKVRDVYEVGDNLLVMVASDRISAFDHVLKRPIPFKGQVLNQIAAKALGQTKDIVPNWLIETPDPNVSIGWKCNPYKIEMVIRGYLAGHAWREYSAGKRLLCGVEMPEGMKENDRFPEPIITPATKAEEGHDEDISREEIIAQGIVPEEEYVKLEEYTRALFQRGTEIAEKLGLILVDTKYEFGSKDGQIMLMDEIHTPDSSRYFYANTYHELQEQGKKQKQLSKEFVREWLISENFQGLEGQTLPEMDDERVSLISDRYIELFEKITNESFVREENMNIHERIEQNISRALKSIKG